MDQIKVNILVNNKPRPAVFKYFATADTSFLQEWRSAAKDRKHPAPRDSIEIAELAVKRWENNHRRENYADGVGDIFDFIKDNPHVEVANFVALKLEHPVPELPVKGILGVVHFRRTWCNNIVLDYLAAHPWVARKNHAHAKITMVGTALLYFLTETARRLNADQIWGEATQNSFDFYMNAMGLTSVRDLFIVPHEKYLAANARMALKLKGFQP